jgi:hypothetical protein
MHGQRTPTHNSQHHDTKPPKACDAYSDILIAKDLLQIQTPLFSSISQPQTAGISAASWRTLKIFAFLSLKHRQVSGENLCGTLEGEKPSIFQSEKLFNFVHYRVYGQVSNFNTGVFHRLMPSLNDDCSP